MAPTPKTWSQAMKHLPTPLYALPIVVCQEANAINQPCVMRNHFAGEDEHVKAQLCMPATTAGPPLRAATQHQAQTHQRALLCFDTSTKAHAYWQPTLQPTCSIMSIPRERVYAITTYAINYSMSYARNYQANHLTLHVGSHAELGPINLPDGNSASSWCCNNPIKDSSTIHQR